jgi:hypothetical protein
MVARISPIVLVQMNGFGDRLCSTVPLERGFELAGGAGRRGGSAGW